MKSHDGEKAEKEVPPLKRREPNEEGHAAKATGTERRDTVQVNGPLP